MFKKLKNKIPPYKQFSKLWFITFLLLINSSIVFGFEKDSIKLIEQIESKNLDSPADRDSFYYLIYNSSNELTPIQQKHYYLKAFSKYNEENRDSTCFNIAYRLNLIYRNSGINRSDVDSALYFSSVMLDVGKKIKSKSCIGLAYQNLGAGHNKNNNFNDALIAYINSLEAYEDSQNPNDQFITYVAIGNLYNKYEDHENAFSYAKKGLEAVNKMTDSIRRAYYTIYICGDLMKYSYKLNQKDTTNYYYQLGIKNSKKIESPSDNRYDIGYYSFHQAASNYFLKENNFQKAKKYMDLLKQNSLYKSGYGYISELNFELKTKNIAKAGELIKNMPESIKDSTSFHQFDYLFQITEYYNLIGDHKKAFENLKKLEKVRHDRNTGLKYADYLKSRLILKENESRIKLLEQKEEFRVFQIRAFSTGILVFSIATILLLIQFFRVRKRNILLKEQGKLINAQSVKIQQEAELKENLFGNISHELKTSLTLISGPIDQLLQKKNGDKLEMRNLELASTYSNQLLKLADQILDLTKNKFEPVKINLYTFHLESLLNYLHKEFQAKAKQQNITYKIHTLSTTNDLLIIDVDKLLYIFKNLILNALKYNKPQGTIDVYASIEDEILTIAIKDNGQGISEEALPYIFDRFFQSTKNKSLQGGVGLGLAICKDYVEQLGGDFQVESTLGLGSKFTIKLPIKTCNMDANIPPYQFLKVYNPNTSALPKIGIGNYNPEEYILLVEDNIDLCNYLHSILENDFHLSFAHDGKNALEQINQKIPKLVITDWMMNGMDGKELIHHLKSNEKLMTIPTLMLTARNSLEDRASVLRVGVDDYLTKPFIADTFKAHVNHLVEMSEVRKLESNNLDSVQISKIDVEFLQNLEETVKKHLSDFDFKLSYLEKELNLSSRQISRKIKKLTGLAPKQYINEARFQEAKRLLETKKYSTVKAVAYSVGFKAEQNFSRNFKKRFGKYPKEILY